MNELLYYDLKNAAGITPGLATQISRELGRRIVAGMFPEGGLIDDENKLCSRFGVSKSVVREAVKLLVAGIVGGPSRQWYACSSTFQLELTG